MTSGDNTHAFEDPLGLFISGKKEARCSVCGGVKRHPERPRLPRYTVWRVIFESPAAGANESCFVISLVALRCSAAICHYYPTHAMGHSQTEYLVYTCKYREENKGGVTTLRFAFLDDNAIKDYVKKSGTKFFPSPKVTVLRRGQRLQT